MLVKIIKKVSKKTYTDNKKREQHYKNYFVELQSENGKKIRIPFNPNYKLDKDCYKELDLVAITENE